MNNLTPIPVLTLIAMWFLLGAMVMFVILQPRLSDSAQVTDQRITDQLQYLIEGQLTNDDYDMLIDRIVAVLET